MGHRLFIWAFLISTLGILSACAPVSESVLHEFSETASEITKNTHKLDPIIKEHHDNIYNREIENSKNDFALLSSVKLDFDLSDAYSSHYPKNKKTPIFIKIKNAEEGLHQVNRAFEAYINVLTQLSSNNLPTEDEFDDYSRDIYKSSLHALKKIDHTHDHRKGMIHYAPGFFGGLLRAYTVEKHRKLLKQVVQKNHASLELYFKQVREGIELLAIGISTDYQQRAQTIMKAAKQRAPDKGLSKEIAQLYTLSNSTKTTLDTLRLFDEIYLDLIKQHRELPQAIDAGKLDLRFIHSRLENLIAVQEDMDIEYQNNRNE